MATVTAPVTTERPRTGSPALVGTLAGVASGAMVMVGLWAAFVGSRNQAGHDFVPTAMKFDNYVATTIVVTLALASAAAVWAVTANNVGNRRWASTGFGLAAFFDVAALNLLWFLGREAGLGVLGSEYAVLVYALFVASGIAIVVGAAAAASGLARVLGAQTSSTMPHLGRAASWPQHLGTLAWVGSWALIYLRK